MNLPRVDAFAARWSLTLGEPIAVRTVTCVVRARRENGAYVVLKVCKPGRALAAEAAALDAFAGHGAVRVLEVDLDGGALLLEEVRPGTSLIAMAREDDAKATAIAAEVMGALR